MKESGEDHEFQTESQQHNPDSIFGHFHCIQPASGGASVQVWTYRPPPPPAAHYGKNDIIGKELDAAQISEFVRLYNRSKVKGTLHNTMLSPSTYIRFSDGSKLEISQQYGTTLGISFTDKSRNGGYSEYIIVNLELTSFLYCIRGTTLSDMYC